MREILWQEGNFLGGNFPWGQLSSRAVVRGGGQFSLGAIILEGFCPGAAIVQGTILLWGNYPRRQLTEEQLSGGQLSGEQSPSGAIVLELYIILERFSCKEIHTFET